MNEPTMRILPSSPEAVVAWRLSARGRRVRGFTLVEVMMGFFVFSLLAVGLSSVVLQARRLAQLNILRTTAFTVAQGYMEQMMSIGPQYIDASADPYTTNWPPLPTMSVSSLTANLSQIQLNDPLYTSPRANLTVSDATLIARTDKPGHIWNVKNVVIDMTGGNNTLTGTTPVLMTMWIDVTIYRNWQAVDQMTNPPSDTSTSLAIPKPAIMILMDFQYKPTGNVNITPRTGSLRTVRTDI